jgi:hypothetical protein
VTDAWQQIQYLRHEIFRSVLLCRFYSVYIFYGFVRPVVCKCSTPQNGSTAPLSLRLSSRSTTIAGHMHRWGGGAVYAMSGNKVFENHSF